jgi:hypothetical protein
MDAPEPMPGRDGRLMTPVRIDDVAGSPNNDNFLARIAVGVRAIGRVAVIIRVAIGVSVGRAKQASGD